MPTAKQARTSSRLTTGPILTRSSMSSLIADDRQDDRDRLVEVAEPLDQLLDEREQRPQAQQCERVGRPDRERVGRDRERGRDRVDRKGDVGRDELTSASSSGRRLALALGRLKKCGPSKSSLTGKTLRTMRTKKPFPGRCSRRRRAGSGRPEQKQQAEHVDDDVEALDQLDADQDREAAHDQRQHDAPEQEHRPVRVGHPEVREDQEEDEQVVERQRALDQVHGRVVDRRLEPSIAYIGTAIERPSSSQPTLQAPPRGSSARDRGRRTAGRPAAGRR